MQINTETTVIGFIGTGIMGRGMIGNLLKAGYRVNIYSRTKTKAEELIKEGAVWVETIPALAARSQVIITMVGTPKDVEDVYFGEGGLIKNTLSGSYLVDMTTSSPILAVKIYQTARQKGMFALDAPVSGGEAGARDALLAIMAGGDQEAFDAILPVLNKIGNKVSYRGPAGSGQNTKLCNQISIGPIMMAVCESLSYAAKNGLDPSEVLKMLEAGTASSWQLINQGPKMLAGNFKPGFYVKHFIKDMKIAANVAQEMGLELPALNLAISRYELLASKGGEELGIQGLFTLYR